MAPNAKFQVAFFLLIGWTLQLAWAKKTNPTALSVPVSTSWLGTDGFWSPVNIRVGTTPQWVSVLVSTASQETWVIGPGGCAGSQECAQKRGGLFTSNQSSTWDAIGVADLGLDRNLGFGGQGFYGLDNISISDTTSLPSQIVGVVNDTDYWTGFLGMGITPTNFTNNNEPTFLVSMVQNKSYIPSYTYGYTAGAYHKLKGVPASLTLGGYDSNRFVPHNVSFELAPENGPIVALNEITVFAKPLASSNVTNDWSGGSKTLLDSSSADLFTIDSSTPFLWLPEEVCAQFEKALGLTYNDTLGLYFYGMNGSQHDTLANWNLTFQFQLANQIGSDHSITLNVSFGAFDLQLQYPYPGLGGTQYSQGVNYFPLRKAANSTQYIIGRAFLQETYLRVDYGNRNFSVHAATFDINPIQDINLISVSNPSNSSLKGPTTASSGSPLSNAAIAGVAVGIFILVFCGIIALCFCLRRKGGSQHGGYVKEKENRNRNYPQPQPDRSKFMRWLLGVPDREMPVEIGGSDVRFALEAPDGQSRTELGTKHNSKATGTSNSAPTSVDIHKHGKAINAIGHDPEKPVELPYRMSHRGFFEPTKGAGEYYGEDYDSATPPVIRFDPDNERRPYSRWLRPEMHPMTGVSSPSDSSGREISSKGSSPVFVVSPVSPGDNSSAHFGSLVSVARREAWYVSDNPDAQTGTNATHRSGESGSGVSPDDSVSQGEISRRSTVSPIEEPPTTRPRMIVAVPTIQESMEASDDDLDSLDENPFNGPPLRESVIEEETEPDSDSSTISDQYRRASISTYNRTPVPPASTPANITPQNLTPSRHRSVSEDVNDPAAATWTSAVSDLPKPTYTTASNAPPVPAPIIIRPREPIPSSAYTPTTAGFGGMGTTLAPVEEDTRSTWSSELGNPTMSTAGQTPIHTSSVYRNLINESEHAPPVPPVPTLAVPTGSANSGAPVPDPTKPSSTTPAVSDNAASRPGPAATNDTPLSRQIRSSIQQGYRLSSYLPGGVTLPPLQRSTSNRNKNTNNNTSITTNTSTAPPPIASTSASASKSTPLRVDPNYTSQSAASNDPLRAPPQIATTPTERASYSPARWIEFWRTGRDPREPRSSSAAASSTVAGGPGAAVATGDNTPETSRRATRTGSGGFGGPRLKFP